MSLREELFIILWYGVDSRASCGVKGIKPARRELFLISHLEVDTGKKLKVSGEGNAGLKGSLYA